VGARSWRLYLLVGSLASVPIVVIPDSWCYTAWYDTVGLSAVVAILAGVPGRRTVPTSAGGIWARDSCCCRGRLLVRPQPAELAPPPFPSVANRLLDPEPEPRFKALNDS
jgi:hypothetical protein